MGSPVTYPPQNQYHQQQIFLRPEWHSGGSSIWAEVGQSSKRTGPETAVNVAGVGLYTIGSLGSETDIAQAGWSQDWSPTLKSTFRINHTKILNGEGNGIFAVPGNPQSPFLVNLVRTALPSIDTMAWLTDYTSNEAAFQVNWEATGNLHFVFGGDTRKMETPGSSAVGIPPSKPTASGSFAAADWNAGFATFSAGLRAENETLGGSRTSPRLAVVVPMDDKSTLRAGYFTSTRSPQMTEAFGFITSPVLAYVSIANPSLKPEEAINFELGYRRTFTRWSLDLTAYQMKLKKFIASTVVGVQGGKPVVQFLNSGTDLTNKGLEITLKGEIRHGWLAGLNGAFVDFRDPVKDDQQTFAPRASGTLWTRVRSGSCFGYLALQRMGAYTRFASGNNKTEDQYAVYQVDFNAGYTVFTGFELSVYGVNAAHQVAYSGAAGLQNQFLTRYARREIGIQASWRF